MSVSTLEGRTGIVTGGTSGIGAAVVHRAGALGARVAYCARTPPVVAPYDDRAQFWPVDLLDYDNVAAFCAEVRQRFGRIDFVVASAGLTLQGRMDEGDPQSWRAVVETNLLGTADVFRAALPAMRDQGGGHLVLVGSVAGRGTHAGEPVYLASKWAIAGLAAALRQELLPLSVRVSLIEPGLTDTPMTRAAPAIEEWLRAVDPLRAEDVAEAIVFILQQPDHVAMNEVLMRPSRQVL